MTSPSRSPEARRAEYLKNRKPRPCGQCGSPLELGSKKRLCDPCRETPDPRCKKCKKVKPLSKFSHDSSRPSGFFPWCKDCQLKGTKSAAFQDESAPLNGNICPLCDTPIRGHSNRKFCSNSCKDRVSVVRNKYSMTVEEYRSLLSDADGFCPICKERPTSWQIDHNHSTSRVTGVVCIKCNVGVLAYSNHDAEYVRSLLSYLEKTPASRLGIDAEVPEKYDQPSRLHRKWQYRGPQRSG